VLPPPGQFTAIRKDASNVPVIDLKTAAALMDPLAALVAKAGAAVLAVKRDHMTIDGKADGSPVTEADLASDTVIADGLARSIRSTAPRNSSPAATNSPSTSHSSPTACRNSALSAHRRSA
jgi:hypothetical protein